MVVQRRINLLKHVPWLRRVLISRLYQPVLMLITLFFFTLAILTGLFGTPAGSRNFSIVFVWIVWWGLLIIVLVPFAGRFWCSICPIPAPGEWLQRRSIVNRVPGKLHTLHWRWPTRFKNMWLQNFGFLGMAIFSVIILTRPSVTGWVLLTIIIVAVVLSILYDKRVFCRYVCPVGGFVGLYSLVAPIEVRVADPAICATHTPKDCLTGNEYGYGCTWMVTPGELVRNAYCGMCAECLKTCPKNNVVINLRPFGSDLLVGEERRLDEAYKAFIMLGGALLYSAVLLGPWGWIKAWANMDTFPHWLAYALTLISVTLLVIPALFGGTALLSKRLSHLQIPFRQVFIDYAYGLIPLGLAAWVAFSFGFVLTNGSYALPVLSDPFGWGWNLFNTVNFSWTPLLPSLINFLQVGTLVIGLLFSVNIVYRIASQHSQVARQPFRATLPIAGFMAGITVLFLWVYLG
jgi:polyferredoxin